jgi:hypothetical protein
MDTQEHTVLGKLNVPMYNSEAKPLSLTLYKINSGAGGVAQVVQHLPNQHEALNLNPRIPPKLMERGHSSVEEHLPSKCKALALISSTRKKSTGLPLILVCNPTL